MNRRPRPAIPDPDLPGVCRILMGGKLLPDAYALVDESDAHLVDHLFWSAQPRHKTWYATANYQDENGRATVYLHKVIMGDTRGLTVDHINGNGLDCRRCNLRLATFIQNNANRGIRSDSGFQFKGVNLRRFRTMDRWRAGIGINGKQVHLGHFDTAEEAARAYDRAALAAYGEFAYLNFPEEVAA